MKNILLILALGLTVSLASSEMNTENEQKVTTKEVTVLSHSKVVIQEIRNARIAPNNREVRKLAPSEPRIARVNRKIREERLVTVSLRDTRAIRYVSTQTNTHLSSLQ